MSRRKARKPRLPERKDEVPPPNYGHSGTPQQVGEGAPEQLEDPSLEEFLREADYGNQVGEYDNHPPGRGHGDSGYGYGSTAGFGPSGGSGVNQ